MFFVMQAALCLIVIKFLINDCPRKELMHGFTSGGETVNKNEMSLDLIKISQSWLSRDEKVPVILQFRCS